MAKKELKSTCDSEPGKLMPVVDFNHCGAKEDCEAICPYEVFELHPIRPEDKAQLNLIGKIKTFFDKRKAYVVKAEACHACGLCVQACPEKAIKLSKFG